MLRTLILLLTLSLASGCSFNQKKVKAPKTFYQLSGPQLTTVKTHITHRPANSYESRLQATTINYLVNELTHAIKTAYRPPQTFSMKPAGTLGQRLKNKLVNSGYQIHTNNATGTNQLAYQVRLLNSTQILAIVQVDNGQINRLYRLNNNHTINLLSHSGRGNMTYQPKLLRVSRQPKTVTHQQKKSRIYRSSIKKRKPLIAPLSVIKKTELKQAEASYRAVSHVLSDHTEQTHYQARQLNPLNTDIPPVLLKPDIRSTYNPYVPQQPKKPVFRKRSINAKPYRLKTRGYSNGQ